VEFRNTQTRQFSIFTLLFPANAAGSPAALTPGVALSFKNSCRACFRAPRSRHAAANEPQEEQALRHIGSGPLAPRIMMLDCDIGRTSAEKRAMQSAWRVMNLSGRCVVFRRRSYEWSGGKLRFIGCTSHHPLLFGIILVCFQNNPRAF
jgi:hypothetical protein